MHNITLPRMDFVSNKGRIDKDLEKKMADDYRVYMDIISTTVEQHVENPSGGNQQKVLLGKWIFSQPEILILVEPSRGVDVGANYEIYQSLKELVEERKSALFTSSERTEILGILDRISMMNRGRLIAEFPAQEATQEIIMNCIMQDSKGEIGA